MRYVERLAAALLMVLLCATPALAASHIVRIDDYTFIPATLTVHPGDIVVWANQDSIPHTATSVDGKTFDSGAIDPGDRWESVFSKTGHFDYRCAIHPEMRGTITVQ